MIQTDFTKTHYYILTYMMAAFLRAELSRDQPQQQYKPTMIAVEHAKPNQMGLQFSNL